MVGHGLQVDRARHQHVAGAGLGFLLELEHGGHDRDGELQRRILAGLERGAVGSEQRHALVAVAQVGFGEMVERAFDRLLVLMLAGIRAEPLIDRGHALRGRQLDVFAQPVGLQFAIHRRVVAALHLLHAAFERRQVALLIALLALGVGLGAFNGQSVQLGSCADHAGAAQLAEYQVAFAVDARFLTELDQTFVRGQRGLALLALLALLAQPLQYRGFLGALGVGRADAFETVQLTVEVLHRVLPAAHGVGVLHRDVGVVLAGGLDQRHEPLVVAADGRVGPVGGGVEIAGQRVTTGRSRVTGDHHEIAHAQWLVGQFQEVPGLIGHIVDGECGGFAVLADVGAVEREIAGVTRPHPVVDLAAVVADAAWRRIHQAHVLDLEVAEQPVGVAAGKAVQAAAEAGFRLTARDQLLFQRLQRKGACKRIGRRRNRRLDLRGHVLNRVEGEDACVRTSGDFRGRGGGVETVTHQVFVRRRVELDRAVRAVVVGDHQALW